MKFEKGKSGNPNGRKKGSRNKVSVAVDDLLDGEAEKLTRKAIEMALEGDSQAMRLCMDRICPPRKERPISINLPTIETAEDVAKGLSTVMEAVSKGDVTPSEASTLAGILETKRRSIETAELADRITELENK